ncbi:MerR family transcriptional regulator [Jatrophihabitans fulvus]
MTETQQLDTRQLALLALVIKGMQRGEPDEATRGLIDEGLAMNKGVITMPTPAGTKTASEFMRLLDGCAERKAIDARFDEFLPINRELREVCSAWQTLPDGTPNDHSDAGHDDEVRERLEDVHRRIAPVIEGFAEVVPRLGRYLPRLQEALEKFRAGEASWLASPLMDSYHTVWMHLHQELILMLGLTRAEDEAREERLVGHAAR